MTRSMRRKFRKIVLASTLALIDATFVVGWCPQSAVGQEAPVTVQAQEQATVVTTPAHIPGSIHGLIGGTIRIDGTDYWAIVMADGATNEKTMRETGWDVATPEYVVITIPVEEQDCYNKIPNTDMFLIVGAFQYVGQVPARDKYGNLMPGKHANRYILHPDWHLSKGLSAFTKEGGVLSVCPTRGGNG